MIAWIGWLVIATVVAVFVVVAAAMLAFFNAAAHADAQDDADAEGIVQVEKRIDAARERDRVDRWDGFEWN